MSDARLALADPLTLQAALDLALKTHPDLRVAGANLAVARADSAFARVPMFNPEYHDNTYAKRLLSIMASFVVGRRGVSLEEANAWLAEFGELGKQGQFFFSLNRYLFVADKVVAS